MIKSDKRRMPLTMLDKFVFSKQRPKTRKIKRSSVAKRHMLADCTKEKEK